MDEQGKLLAKVNLRATEARSAAVGAQDQTNPKLYGELIAKTVDANPKATPLLTGCAPANTRMQF